MELQQCAAVLLNTQFSKMEKWEDKEGRKEYKSEKMQKISAFHHECLAEG